MNFLGAVQLRLRCAALALCVTGCGGVLDVGGDRRALLPVGADNPVILLNDSVYDNWQGEYTLLFERAGGARVLGIVVSTGGIWGDLAENYAGWQDLVQSARASGLPDVPEPLQSPSTNLRMPEDGSIAATVANESAGALFIVEESRRSFEQDARPVVLLLGGRFTDVADAYLMDPSVTERVVVVASAGGGLDADASSAEVGVPNGEMDPWASQIVAQKFTYVQVAGHYDQLADVPESRRAELPSDALGEWIGMKASQIARNRLASDQVGVLATQLEGFVQGVVRVAPAAFDGTLPQLRVEADGPCYLVTDVDGSLATRRFWELLLQTP